VLGGSAFYEDYREREGQGAGPTITDRYTPITAPALGTNPAFAHTTAIAGIDWRTSPGYSRRGGLYEVQYHNYAGVGGAATFDRLDAEVVQHLPLLRETWVLSLRGRMQSTLGNDVVPYFLLPSLGSGSTLRGYATERFHDRHSLLLQGEWRWIPNRLGLDMALFYDAGKVASRRDDLDLKGLKHDVGVGIRLHGPAATPLRIEVAKGSEGWHLVFSGSPAF
jgi:hemolysin activation/secretion protein